MHQDRNLTAKPTKVLKIEDKDSLSDSDEDWDDIPNFPASSPHVITPDPDLTYTEPSSDATTPNNASLELGPPPLSFLDPTAGNEFEPPTIAVGTIVAGLLKEAKQHKSFAVLFKLHAVHNFLKLHERYQLVPNIKNPVM